jgi:hypothetical protein
MTNSDGIRLEMRIQRVTQTIARPIFEKINMRNLPQGVYAGICSACAMHNHSRAINRKDRVF